MIITFILDRVARWRNILFSKFNFSAGIVVQYRVWLGSRDALIENSELHFASISLANESRLLYRRRRIAMSVTPLGMLHISRAFKCTRYISDWLLHIGGKIKRIYGSRLICDRKTKIL